MSHDYGSVPDYWTYPINDLIGSDDHEKVLEEMKEKSVDKIWIDFVSSWVVNDETASIPEYKFWPESQWPSALAEFIYRRRLEQSNRHLTDEEINSMSSGQLSGCFVSNLHLFNLAYRFFTKKKAA